MNRYYQLTREQRYQIGALRDIGVTQKMIAAQVGVSPSTISRELRRNSVADRYDAAQADQVATRRRRTAAKAVRIGPELLGEVEDLLRQEWSPEQVSGHLRKRAGASVSHERIYQHVRWDKTVGGDLYTYLRHGMKRRRRYGKPDLRGHIRGRVSIEERPSVVDRKERLGDWEIDTVHGHRSRGGALLTIVDRKAKYARLKRLPDRKAATVAAATIDLLGGLGERALTITADNGKEFADHARISEEVGAAFFFAHPYSSWERGLNEQTNGLIRQYFPKGSDFTEIEDWEVQWVEDRLNSRPRKTLGYATPAEVFHGQRE